MQELLHESIYADLLIIQSRETLTHYPEEPPTRFVRELLEGVQCGIGSAGSIQGDPKSKYPIRWRAIFGFRHPHVLLCVS